MRVSYCVDYKPTGLLENGEEMSFDETSHTYCLRHNGMMFSPPSVTQVLKAVFGNKYTKAGYEKLLKAQEKGKVVHSEIKDLLVSGSCGVSLECLAASRHINTYYTKDSCYCEQYVYANTPFGMFAGTLDAFWLDNEKVVDYKTSTKLDKANTKRQLNMYRYALKHTKTNWAVTKLEAWHIVGDRLRVVPFTVEPDEYVETIMRAYHDGKTFKNDKEMMDYYHKPDSFEEEKKYEKEKEYDDTFNMDCAKIYQVDELISQLKNTREKIATRIKEHLERRDLKDCYVDGVRVTYIPETEKEIFDVARYKELNPYQYRDYVKKSIVKSHIRISYNKEK